MKCVILAGGKGTRISELSKSIPKPMIKILGKPIILRIIMHYYKFGFKDFIIAAGYKKKIITNYFKNKKIRDLKIKIIDTGLNTMTGGRLKRLWKYLQNETFMLTYGDGLSNVNIRKLVNFHKKNKRIATLTAVRPPARFGAIRMNGNKIKYFKEKSKLDVGWINGGFFVFESKIFKYIKGDKTFLEREPLQKICKSGELNAFRHEGFWQREINYWDIAAGIVILKEAGGFVDFFEEDTNLPLKKNILATNSNIHDELRELINKKDIE